MCLLRFRQLLIIISGDIRRFFLNLRLKDPQYLKKATALISVVLCFVAVVVLLVLAILKDEVVTEIAFTLDTSVTQPAIDPRITIEHESGLYIQEAPEDGILNAIGTIEIRTLDIYEYIFEGAGDTQLRYGLGLHTDYAPIGDTDSMIVVVGHRTKAAGVMLNGVDGLSPYAHVVLKDAAGKLYTYVAEYNNVVLMDKLKMTLEEIKKDTGLCIVTYESDEHVRLIRCRFASVSEGIPPAPWIDNTPSITPAVKVTPTPDNSSMLPPAPST